MRATRRPARLRRRVAGSWHRASRLLGAPRRQPVRAVGDQLFEQQADKPGGEVVTHSCIGINEVGSQPGMRRAKKAVSPKSARAARSTAPEQTARLPRPRHARPSVPTAIVQKGKSTITTPCVSASANCTSRRGWGLICLLQAPRQVLGARRRSSSSRARSS